MLSFILMLMLVALSVIVSQLIYIMANISTLTPRLQEIQNKVNTVSLNVQSLRDQLANAGEISAQSEALLFNLNATLDALIVNSVVPPSEPQPGPLP